MAPELLVSQVRNTAPYVFEGYGPGVPYLEFLRGYQPGAELSLAEYFRLCVCAHYSSCGTPVPTDVDNAIRSKLWLPSATAEQLEGLAQVVEEALSWDPRPVSARTVTGPVSGQVLAGHHGEWFSIAAAAYGAFRRRAPERAAHFGGLILAELQREAAIFNEFRDARDGLGLLKAATQIAHNLGDLDRVLDEWGVKAGDALHDAAYKAGHERGERFERKALTVAGALYQASIGTSSMAEENHRHFALRTPRGIRKSPDLLIPVGPFFDDWGACLARHPALSTADISETVQALVDGWQRLGSKTVGYPRALAGLLEAFPGGPSALARALPAKLERELRGGALRALISIPKRRFEDQWANQALAHVSRLGRL